MPLVTSTEMFKKAYNGGYAIGAFNVNNMEIVHPHILFPKAACGSATPHALLLPKISEQFDVQRN